MKSKTHARTNAPILKHLLTHSLTHSSRYEKYTFKLKMEHNNITVEGCYFVVPVAVVVDVDWSPTQTFQSALHVYAYVFAREEYGDCVYLMMTTM